MKKAGIWIRVSTEDQAKGDSPEHHEKRARDYANFSEWEIVDKYDLSGVSGKTVINHPLAKQMLEDVASGKIQGLIFSKIARLARNVKELIEISEHFEKYNAHLISLEEKIDTSSAAGKLLFTVIGALAQWEREEISSRVSASIPVRAKMGKPTGGKGPFGYEWIDKKLTIKPSEASVVREVYSTFMEIKKFLTTARILNERGLRTSNGAKFCKTSVKRILTDPVYKGKKRANYTKSKGNRKSWIFKDKKDWIFIDVEPIIEVDVWENINHMIRQIETKYPKEPLFLGKYSFSGLLRCGCGGKMYAHAYKGITYSCKKCRNKLSETALEEHVIDSLRQIVIHPEQLIESSEQDEKGIKEREEFLKGLRKELKRITEKIDNLIFRENELSPEDFKKKYATLKEHENQIQEQIPQKEVEIASLKTSELGKKQLLAQAISISSLWETFDKDTRIKLTKELINKITVSKEKLISEFFYLPEFMEFGKSDHGNRGSWLPGA